MAKITKAAFMASQFLGGVAVTLPVVALAQIAPTNEGTNSRGADTASGVEEIIVTAQKRAESINSVPISISAASGESLQKFGVKTPQDLAKIVPGFTATDNGNGIPVLTLRGIGYYSQGIGAKPTVAVYQDEQPLPFSVMAKGATLDLERVEVLKGPQGILFGGNTTGGAINYIAAKPTREAQGGMNVEYGRFNSFDVSGFISGPIARNVQARVAVRTEQGGDWQKSTTQNLKLGRSDFTSFRGILEYTPESPLTISVNVNGFFDRSDTQAAQFEAIQSQSPALLAIHTPSVLTRPVAPENPRAADWTNSEPLRRDDSMLQFSGRIDYEFGKEAKLTFLSAYSDYKQNFITDVDGVPEDINKSRVRGDIKSFTQEIRMSGYFSDKFKYVAGFNYEHSKIKERNLLSFADATASYALGDLFGSPALYFDFSDIDTKERYKTYAAFANVDYDISSTLTAHLGARYTKTDVSFDACNRVAEGDPGAGLAFAALTNVIRAGLGLPVDVPPILPGECYTIGRDIRPSNYESSLKEDNVSWRAVIDWKPDSGTLLYANISRGYKAGGFDFIAATNTAQLQPVRQESVLAIEGGFKKSLFDRKIQINGAMFHYKYSDKQILGTLVDPVFGPLQALVNIPKSKVNGVELQLSARPNRFLTFDLAGTYVDSKLGNYLAFTKVGSIENVAGNSFPYTAKWQISANAEYRIPLNDDLSVFFGGNLNYASHQNASLERDPNYSLPARTLIDLRAGVENLSGDMRFSIWGRNITNEYYLVNVLGSLDTRTRLTGRPATYGVSFGYKFR